MTVKKTNRRNFTAKYAKDFTRHQVHRDLKKYDRRQKHGGKDWSDCVN